MEVQIFGTRKSADTRKALRFFSDRRVKAHFVDFSERGPALGELKRWVQKFGLDALIDRDSPRHAALGLRHARYGDERWIQLLADEPLLLRQPLARALGAGSGSRLTIGVAEEEWKAWLATEGAR